MRLRLTDACVRSHRGTNKEAVGGVREQGLRDDAVVGRADETRPHIEIGRTDEFGVSDVDAVRVADLPGPVVDRSFRPVTGCWHIGHRVAVMDEVWLVCAE